MVCSSRRFQRLHLAPTSQSAFNSGDKRGATETGSPRRRNGRNTAVREFTALSTTDSLDRPIALHPLGVAEMSSRPRVPSPVPPRRAGGEHPPLAPALTINLRTRSQSSVTDQHYPGSSPQVASYPKPLLAAPYPRLSAGSHHPPLNPAPGVYGDSYPRRTVPPTFRLLALHPPTNSTIPSVK